MVQRAAWRATRATSRCTRARCAASPPRPSNRPAIYHAMIRFLPPILRYLPPHASPSTSQVSAIYHPNQVWRVPITALEPALARVAAAGKTALLLDGTGERVTDMYFMYSEATVIEAKKVAAPCNHPATTLQPTCNHPATTLHALGTPSAPAPPPLYRWSPTCAWRAKRWRRCRRTYANSW